MKTHTITAKIEVNRELQNAFILHVREHQAGHAAHDLDGRDFDEKIIQRAERGDLDREELAWFLLSRAGFGGMSGGIIDGWQA